MSGEGVARDGAEPISVEDEAEMRRIVEEEERVLGRVTRTLAQHRPTQRGTLIDYDKELLELRDQIRDARLEDIPPLVEEMERLQQVAQRRAQVTEGIVDPSSPYFGRIVLEEDDKRREVLIGRATYLDPTTGIRIVDWRDAPVSRIYYRYEEGDDYDEQFGDRTVEGEVLVRRSLRISDQKLRRIASPQGTFARRADGSWKVVGDSAIRLAGGQGSASRPSWYHKPGKLGVGGADDRDDKVLSEITALIDPAQFELITKPTSGLVVIQGGAGSGKTTIGLHRLAYLAFQDPKRFRADQMLVVVFNDALVRYIAQVLPALGVENVRVVTFERWAEKLRQKLLPLLPETYSDSTPAVVHRFKKHPVLMRVIDAHAAGVTRSVDEIIEDTAKRLEGGGKALRIWQGTAGKAPVRRLEMLKAWLEDKQDGGGAHLPLETRHSVERAVAAALRKARDVIGVWAELLTDQKLLQEAFDAHAPGSFSPRELSWVHSWCAQHCTLALSHRDERREARGRDEGPPAEEHEGSHGVDGAEEAELATLDREDDALLLRLWQQLRGSLGGKGSDLRYEHIFVDEAQDISPVELAVVLGTATERQSVTLAGDVAQKLYMDNGFTTWNGVLHELGLDHIEIEPLKLSYRSTHEILEFAVDVLGPLRNEVVGEATRHGVPVELFRFGNSGEAVAFLSEALRNLMNAEPQASVAVIGRYPEQVDVYYHGLARGEVPRLRRIADQDFPFKPGVDVTDVRQVKGLEFDYVVLIDCNAPTYPEDDESRHLLHIAATRAAHQLWVTTTGTPSALIPQKLQDEAG